MTYLPGRIPAAGEDDSNALTLLAAPLVWAIPNVTTELGGVTTYRQRVDLSNKTSARFSARIVAALASASLKIQYSTDESSWSDLTNTIDTSDARTAVADWLSIAEPARADVILRAVGSGGNGILTVTLGLVAVQVR